MLSMEQRLGILKTVSIFGDTPNRLLVNVAELLEEESLPADVTFIKKGDQATCMYVIVSGDVRVHDGDIEFNRLGANEIVGEMALLDPAPRSASVTSLTPTHLLKLDSGTLFKLMAERSEVAQAIIRVLVRRLRDLLKELGRH